jgi:hypothetical protein
LTGETLENPSGVNTPTMFSNDGKSIDGAFLKSNYFELQAHSLREKVMEIIDQKASDKFFEEATTKARCFGLKKYFAATDRAFKSDFIG